MQNPSPRSLHRTPSSRRSPTRRRSPEPACTAKPTSTSLGALQLLHHDHVRVDDPLQHQLRASVPLRNLKVLVLMVEQQHKHRATVVIVDDARAGSDAMLGREAGARGDAAVCAGRNGDGDVGGNEGFAAGRDGGGLGAVCGPSVKSTIAKDGDGARAEAYQYRSYPAANLLPRVGGFAVSLRSFTCSGAVMLRTLASWEAERVSAVLWR